MIRPATALAIFASVSAAALLVAANVTESENPLANYEASDYCHCGMPWTAVVIGDPDRPDPRLRIQFITTTDGYSDLTALKVNCSQGEFIVLFLPLAMDLAFAGALLVPVFVWVLRKRRRPRLLQSHLRTAVLLVLVAGGLLGLNLRQRECDYYGAPAGNSGVECLCHGWPCDYSREWPNRYTNASTREFKTYGLALDVLAGCLILFSAAQLLETVRSTVPQIAQPQQLVEHTPEIV